MRLIYFAVNNSRVNNDETVNKTVKRDLNLPPQYGIIWYAQCYAFG